MTTNAHPYCHYMLDQIQASGLLSPERMTEVEQAVESRIHPVFLHTGKEIPNARFVGLNEGKGILHPRVDDENSLAYAKRQALVFILTPAELELINEHCLSAARAKREAEQFATAEKLTVWEDGVFLGDTYHHSLGEALEELENTDQEDHPAYLWAAKGHAVVSGMDASDIAERFIEQNGWEDMETSDLHGLKELQQALEKFEADNAGIMSYEPDYTKAILITP